MSEVVVVIPVYKKELTAFEKISLEAVLKRLAPKHPIIFTMPEWLAQTGVYQQLAPMAQIQTFEDHYFQNIAGYNALLTSKHFYQAFKSYTYMLIYQLDAYVFNDNLDYWCSLGYDYIGAPAFFGEAYTCLKSTDAKTYEAALSQNRLVFNGGLSLRKISAMIRLLNIYSIFYGKWKGNEDMLFSLDATRLLPLRPFMKLPDWKTALQFSFEKSPEASFEINSQKLPFACHAWEKYDISFWEKHIPISSRV